MYIHMYIHMYKQVWAQLSAYPTFYKKQDRRACVNVICFFEANFLPKMSATHWNH